MKRAIGRLIRYACLAACSVAAIGILSRQPTAFGQEARPLFARTYAFRFLLGVYGLNFKPLPDFRAIQEDPKDTLLIFLGDTEASEFTAHQIRQFLDQGGAILVATDRKLAADFEDVFGLSVPGWRLRAINPRYQYMGNKDCPVVTNFSSHAIFKRIHRVATNVPSFLLKTGRGANPFLLASRFDSVAWFPPVTVVGGLPIQVQPPFAMAFQGPLQLAGPESRILVLADDSVFIDGMMLRRDNDNFVFAYNCLDWLRGPVQRTKVLLVDHGKPVDNFEVPVQWVPDAEIPSLPEIPAPPVQIVNHLIADLEDENILNRLILGIVPLGRVLSVLAVALTLCLFVLGFCRLQKGRHRIEMGAPLWAAAASRQATSASVVDQRYRAMLDAGNMWEAARDLARQCFPSSAVSQQGGSAYRGVSAPRLRVAGGWRQRWRLRRYARRLWKLAYDTQPRRVSAREFTRLVAWAKTAQAALAEGTLRIEEVGPD